jgi:hypothetical protein
LMGMKRDRDFMELARGKLSVERIAAKLKIEPRAVIKTGRCLGIYFPPKEPERNGLRKRK